MRYRSLKEFLKFHNEGRMGPIPEVHAFKIEDLQQAFRTLQNGSHIGKVVLTDMEDLEKLPAVPSVKAIEFDPDAAYLLTGGMGGLGRSMATWLVERGARSLTFLSRSAGASEENRHFVEELESLGCKAVAVTGAVDKMEDVKRAIAATTAPIKGVFHLAMVLKVS